MVMVMVIVMTVMIADRGYGDGGDHSDDCGDCW